jgi:hypothetical protein
MEKQPNKAFIGVSLDNQIFLTDWLSLAIKRLVTNHDKVLFLIADNLLRYTRTTIEKNDIELLDLTNIEAQISKRKNRFTSHLDKSLSNFSEIDKAKIEVKIWSDFEDYQYVELLRNLIVAFYNIKEFRDDVYAVAHTHLKKFSNSDKYDNLLNSSAIYIIDEVSMAMRVSELGGYYNEYYPTDEVPILTNIYNDTYKESGLTVSDLIKHTPRRTFNILNILNT